MLELRLKEAEQREVEGLAGEFDPERLISESTRAKAAPADWESWLKVERQELRDQLAVAAFVGEILEHLAHPWTEEPQHTHPWARDPQVRLQLFYGVAERLTPSRASEEDLDAAERIHGALSTEESDALWESLHRECRRACRRMLRVDRGPQLVAG